MARDVEYTVDGMVMVGRLALPDGEAVRPAVLIAHEGPGLDDHQRRRAEQLAKLGYVAFALDYHGGGQLLSDRAEMMTRLGALGADPDRTRTLARAGLDVLLAEPRADGSNVAAIGYCFGGTVALELARGGAALKAVVGFHPGLSTVRPEDAANIAARVLVFVGTEDPFIPLDQRLAFEAEMRDGGVDWEMVLYGGAEHSFTHPAAIPEQTGLPGIKYDARAAERSWRTMLELFDEVFA